MGWGEILVIILIGFFCLNPKDFQIFLRQLRYWQRKFSHIKTQFWQQIEAGDLGQDQTREINQYLAKIAEMGKPYEGPYGLEEIKQYYKKLHKKESSPKAEETKAADATKRRR